MSMKNSNDTIKKRTHDLPAYSAVRQETAPPRKIIEVFLLLGCYAAHVGSGLPKFRDRQVVKPLPKHAA